MTVGTPGDSDRRALAHHVLGCEYGRCEILSSEQGQGRRLVLWLWRLHNAVSMRVLREHPAKQETSLGAWE